MSDNSEQQFLDMAALAAAEKITAPGAEQSTESPAATHGKHFILKLKDDLGVEIHSRRQRVFANGQEASYNFPWPLRDVEPPAGKTPEQLEKGDKVTFITGDGSVIAATVVRIHKEQRGKLPKVTLHTVWPNDQVEPADLEPTQSSSKRAKRKADPTVPTEFSAGAPEPVAVVFVSMRDFSAEPTPAEVGSRLRELAGFVAPANAKRTVVLLAEDTTVLYTERFLADTPDVREMTRGFAFKRSNFEPDSLDLEKIFHWVAQGDEAAVVLAYQNATVVNAPLPHMAFNDDSWPARLAAAADAVVAAFSPARSTTTTEPDSSSDNEHSALAAPEVVDLTLDFDHDDSAQSATAPAPRTAQKRKRPEQVEYYLIDD